MPAKLNKKNDKVFVRVYCLDLSPLSFIFSDLLVDQFIVPALHIFPISLFSRLSLI